MNQLIGLTPQSLAEHFKQVKLQSAGQFEFVENLIESNDALTVQICEALWLLLEQSHALEWIDRYGISVSKEQDNLWCATMPDWSDSHGIGYGDTPQKAVQVAMANKPKKKVREGV